MVVKPVLVTWRSKKDGTYPLKLRISLNKNGKQEIKFFPFGISLKNSHFKKGRVTTHVEDYDELNNEIDNKVSKARLYFMQHPESSAKDILDYLLGKKITPEENKITFKKYGDDLIERYNTDGSKILMRSIFKKVVLFKGGEHERIHGYSFRLSDIKGGDFLISEIDYSFLKDYENYCRKKGNSTSTIQKDLKKIQVLTNDALKRGYLANDPFKHYKKPSPSQKEVEILTYDELELFKKAKLEKSLSDIRDIFLFQVYCEGCGISDAMLMPWENIVDGSIKFIRHKTRNKKQMVKYVFITEPLKEILDRQEKDRYRIFKFLDEDYTYVELNGRRSTINKGIKVICDKLGIKKHITSHCARHTFASLMDEHGAPLKAISDSLGHSSVSVTDAYMRKIRKHNNSHYLDKLFNKGQN